jgi:hypothetical protein
MLQRPTVSLRARNSLLLTISTRTQHSFSLNIEAAKAQAAHWEPALKFPSNPHRHDTQDIEDNAFWVAMHSAVHPGTMCPLLISGFALNVKNGFPNTSKTITETTKTKQYTAPEKPWPYSLPKSLQPQAGTTFEMIHGSILPTRTQQHVGILQAVLYGLPDPDKVSVIESMVREGGGLYKVLYGVKEVGGDEDGTASKKSGCKTL